MTALVVDGDYAAAHPQVIAGVLDNLGSSEEWVVAHPAEAGALVEKHDLGLRAPEVAAAIPRSNYVGINAAQARPAL
jgi:NitT/TauT family transport system substrate-binding protein